MEFHGIKAYLIFWMAEVSGAVDRTELEDLANQIIESADYSKGKKPIYDRIKWNKEIQKVCLDKIINKVEIHG